MNLAALTHDVTRNRQIFEKSEAIVAYHVVELLSDSPNSFGRADNPLLHMRSSEIRMQRMSAFKENNCHEQLYRDVTS